MKKDKKTKKISFKCIMKNKKLVDFSFEENKENILCEQK